MRTKLEEERQALAAFVKKFDALGLGNSIVLPPTKLKPPMPTPGGAAAVFAERQQRQPRNLSLDLDPVAEASPVRFNSTVAAAEPSLLEEEWDGMDEASFEIVEKLLTEKGSKSPRSPLKEVFAEKENLPV